MAEILSAVALRRLEQNRFGEFKLQTRRCDIVAGEIFGDDLINLRRQLELRSGDIDGDSRRRNAQVIPGLDLLTSMVDHPFPDRDDASGRLRDRDEGVRQHQAAFWMIPSDQRLQPDNPSGLKFHLRLIEQFEFAALDRVPQLFADDYPLAGLVVEFGDMEAELIAAFVLAR